jgi:hypothetical protein
VGKLEAARVGCGGVHAQIALAGARTELVDQLGIGIDRRHVVSMTREVDGDAARARSDVQHRSTGAFRERAPEWQIEVVCGALHVVPDDGVARQPDHRPATPRRASSSRSSSSAV